MTNEREQRPMWRRDWSAMALVRANRWRNRGIAPRPASIGRTVTQPTLRLFGAGKRPGPSTATALPRSLPLVLRLRSPMRPPEPPMLTLQSDMPPEVMAEAQQTTPVAQLPEGVTDQALTTEASAGERPAVETAERPREVRQSSPSLVSRALRLFRKATPPPATEEAPVAAQPELPASGEPAPVVESTVEPPVVRQPARPAAPPSPALVLRHTAEAPAAHSEETPAVEPRPTLSEAAPTPPPAEAAQPVMTAQEVPAPVTAATPETPTAQSSPAAPTPEPARAAEAPRAPAAPRGGVMYALRRLFRPEPPPAPEAAPARREAPPAVQAPATPPPVVARQPETPATAPVLSAETEATPVEAPVQEPPRLVEPSPTDEASAVRPVETPRPGQGGLLLTLRRLFRAEPEPEAESLTTSSTEAPRQQAPATLARQASAPEPTRPARPAASTPERLPGELPIAPQDASPAPVMRSASDDALTLARPRTVQAPEPETHEVGAELRSAASAGGPPTPADAPPQPRTESPATLPGRRLDAPGRGATPPPAPAVARRVARPATPVRSDGRSGGAATAVQRFPRPAASAPPKPSLVYLARKHSAADADHTPAGMTTYQVPREQLERMGHQTNADRGRDASGGLIARLGADDNDNNDDAFAGGPTATVADVPEAEGETPSEQINLETLARRVYDRIRARLRIERERSGLSSGVVSR